MEKLPRNRNGNGGGSSGDTSSISVHGDIYLQANDIAELRKLANEHPELAQQVVNDRRDVAIFEGRTERLGMVLAVIFGISLISGTSVTLVALGWWQSIMFVAALLGISHILRTFLKGEFSETSWFGRIMTSDLRESSESADSDP